MVSGGGEGKGINFWKVEGYPLIALTGPYSISYARGRKVL